MVDLGNLFSGAIKSDGTLWLWGNNYYGQLGTNSSSLSNVGYGFSSPTQIGTRNSWTRISLGWNGVTHGLS